MAIAEPSVAPATIDKGLQVGALGLVGNIVIGLAAVAPAYSLAATLGYVVLAVGEKAPAMFVLAFIPMLLVAFAYKELSQDTSDCGTTFTWGTKAFGPWIGWIGGWGLAVSAIIVLANVAEIAAIYLFRFLGQDALAENLWAKVSLGSFFIIAMTLVSARGIVLSERMQNVLIAIQFGVLITYAVQSFAGFGNVGIGLNNAMNTDDVLTILGEPVAGSLVASLLLLTVSVSALSSTQTTILPTARGTLSMAVYEAIPKRFASVHPQYMTPAFGTIVMGISAVLFYLLLTFLSENALADSVASLGLAVAFYYGVTAYACVWYFRKTLVESSRNLFFRGIFPLLGGLAMTWAFIQSAVDMIKPDYGYTAFGPLGGVFVLGVGMLVLGIPLMLACFAFGTKRFFRGETLDASTEVKVPDM